MKKPSKKSELKSRECLEAAYNRVVEENKRLRELVNLQEFRIQSGIDSHLITADIFQTIVNSTEDGIMIEDEEGTVIFANGGFVKMLGYDSSGEVIGRKWTDFFSYHTERKTGAGLETVECMLTRKDSTKMPVIVTNSAYYKSGDYTGVLTFIKDIRNRKDLEEKELRLTQRASHIQKMEALVTLASGIVHDFNNTIGVIRGFAETGICKSRGGNNVDSDLKSIIEATRMAESLVSQLLDFSRSENTERHPCNINDVVEDICEIVERTFPPEISIRSSLAGGSLSCMADKHQILQMLLNICINARDAMPGGGELIIESNVVSLKGTGSNAPEELTGGTYALIRIQDTGEGIPEDVRARVFEPFFTTKPAGKGSGLGLAQAYGTVRGHGGSIRIHSVEGTGTTVEIYLPVQPETGDNEKMPKGKKIKAASAAHGLTLLAIDDNRLMLSLVKNIASLNGINLYTAGNAETGLRMARERANEIDVVIVDQRLSGTSGLDLCRELKKLDSNIKIVLFSGNEPGNLIVGPGALSDAFLKKPFTADKFISTITALVE